tara:strand:- start:78 stop:299 length:222 start_codon:yes stop_codon:yes gene_type:complete
MATLEELLHHAGHDLSEAKAKHNLDMDWIFKLLSDADDALSILDTNPDAQLQLLRVAHRRIKNAMKYTQENKR